VLSSEFSKTSWPGSKPNQAQLAGNTDRMYLNLEHPAGTDVSVQMTNGFCVSGAIWGRRGCGGKQRIQFMSERCGGYYASCSCANKNVMRKI